jgi:hypothetical protein
MSELKEVETAQRGAVIYGVPISWIIVWGALAGFGTFIPLVVFIEGGSMFTLASVFGIILGMVLGPVGGFIAGCIGGTIGLFLNPVAYATPYFGWMGPGIAALIAGSMANGEWRIPLLTHIVWIIGFVLFPYVLWPGPTWAGALTADWYMALVWIGWAPLVIVAAGVWFTKLIPNWLREGNYAQLFVAMWLTMWVARENEHTLGWIFYNVQYQFPMFFNVFIGVYIVWWQATLMFTIGSIIATAIIIGLRRSGLRKIERAIW